MKLFDISEFERRVVGMIVFLCFICLTFLSEKSPVICWGRCIV